MISHKKLQLKTRKLDRTALRRNLYLYIPGPFLLVISLLFFRFQLLEKLKDRVPVSVFTTLNFFFVSSFHLPTIVGPLVRQPRPKGLYRRVGVFTGLVYLCVGAFLAAYSSAQRIRAIGADVPEHLIEDGAYRHMRHPSYAGVLLMATGLNMITGASYTGTLFPIQTIAFLAELKIEESEQLMPLFGDEYRAYREATPCFSRSSIVMMTIAWLYSLFGAGSAGRTK